MIISKLLKQIAIAMCHVISLSSSSYQLRRIIKRENHIETQDVCRTKYWKYKEAHCSCGIMKGSGIHGPAHLSKKLHDNCIATCAADKSDNANNNS